MSAAPFSSVVPFWGDTGVRVNLHRCNGRHESRFHYTLEVPAAFAEGERGALQALVTVFEDAPWASSLERHPECVKLESSTQFVCRRPTDNAVAANVPCARQV